MSDTLAGFLNKLTKYLLTPMLFVGLIDRISDGNLARHFPEGAPYIRFLSDMVMALPLAAGGFIVMFGLILRWFVGFLRERAVFLDAEVVELKQERFKPEKYPAEDAQYITRPVVAFEHEGQRHEVALQSASSSFDKLKIGDVLAVRVQPDELDNVDLADSGNSLPWIFVAIGAGLLGFFGWAMQPGWLAWLLAGIIVSALYKRAYGMLQGKLMSA